MIVFMSQGNESKCRYMLEQRVVIQGRALMSTCEAPGWPDGSWMMQNNGREIATRTTVRYDRTANIPVPINKSGIRNVCMRPKAHPLTDAHIVLVQYQYSYITERWWEVTSGARVLTVAHVYLVRCGIALCADMAGSLGITRN